MNKLAGRLRRYLVTGLIVTAPVGVTVFVLSWLFDRLDPIVGRFIPPIGGYRLPGLGLASLIVLLVLVGWISQKAVGRRLLRTWNGALNRVPVARRLYGASAQVFQAVLTREEKLFQHCAIIEYPSPGMHALVFETAPAPRVIEEVLGEPAVSVFLPTVPNPTSGFLLLLPRRQVHRLGLTVEEGMKMIFSAGIAIPAVPPSKSSQEGA